MQTTTQPTQSIQRGRIVAYQTSGQGTVSVAGAMHAFDVVRHWRSESAPALNTLVDISFGDDGQVEQLVIVSTQQQTQEDAKRAAEKAKQKGLEVWGNARAVLGVNVLASLGALIVGAFMLNTINIRLFASVSRSYWQLLGLSADSLENLSNAMNGGFTAAQFFFLVALAACAATMLVRDPKAALGKCAPLLFIVLHGVMLYFKITSSIADASAAAGSFGGARAGAMADQMVKEMLAQVMHGLSLGLGFYVVLAASIALACFGYSEYRTKRHG